MDHIRLAVSALFVFLIAAAPAQRRSIPTGPVDVTGSVGLDRTEFGLRGGGRHYAVEFSQQSVKFLPALGDAVSEPRHLTLRPMMVRRDHYVSAEVPSRVHPSKRNVTALYRHAPGLRERYELTPEHVALSWVFDEPPPGRGDLVVSYDFDTNLPAPMANDDGGFDFTLPTVGGVRFGGVTGIDAGGAKAAGSVRVEGGRLDLVLPGDFVDTASYPLVLDPLIGATVTAGATPRNPDVAYDATTDRFLVVYATAISASTYNVRAQYIDAQGQLAGNFIGISYGGIIFFPRVANLATRDRFGIVFRRSLSGGGSHTVEFRALTGTTVTHSFQLAFSPTDVFRHVGIGCDTNAPIGSNRGFVAVWEDEALDDIRARRIYFSANDTLLSPSAVTVFSDGGLTFPYTYSEPAISRGGSHAGDLLVVARYYSGLGPSIRVYGRIVPSDGSPLGPSAALFATQTPNLYQPAVDGWSGRWVLAWHDYSIDGVRTRSVKNDPNGPGFLLGTVTTPVGAGGSNRSRSPAVGYTPGRSWLAFLRGNFDALRVEALDSGQCQLCNDQFNSLNYSDPPAMATTTSGGAAARELAIATWHRGGSAYAQVFRNYNLGSSANLGGGCGNGGSQSLSHAPGIGSGGIVCELSGLPPTALLTVFSFGPPATALTCGPCEWAPFQATLTSPITAGGASVQFAIPCLSSLISSQFEMQWTTIDLTQAGCPAFPGLVLSDRLLMTIGQ